MFRSVAAGPSSAAMTAIRATRPASCAPRACFSSSPYMQQESKSGEQPDHQQAAQQQEDSSASTASPTPSPSAPRPARAERHFLQDMFTDPNSPVSASNPSNVGAAPVHPAHLPFGNASSPFAMPTFGTAPARPLSPEELVKAHEDAWSTRKVHGPPPATRSTGRTVTVSHGDVNAAMGILRSIIGRNGIATQLRQQARYEKPNQMRNRVKRERRRTQFAAMIRRKVQLVSHWKQKAAT